MAGPTTDRRYSFFAAGLCLLLLSACGGSGHAPAPAPPSTKPPAASLERLEIGPAAPRIAAGTSLDLQATGLYDDGSRQTLSGGVTWQSDAPSVASVADDGRVTGLGTGQSQISASLDGVSASLMLEVTAASLQRLEITPAQPRLALGTQSTVHAFGLFSDGSRQPLDGQVSWRSLAESVFSVTAEGRISAHAAGNGELQASLDGHTQTVTVAVSAADLTALRATPASLDLPAGGQLTVQLDGLYSDGRQQALGGLADWQIDDPAIAEVTGSSAQGITLHGLAPGRTTLHARYDGRRLDLPLTVSDAVLADIELDLGQGELPVGLSRQLRALGHFSDGELRDISQEVIWQSQDESRLVIANAAGREGLATALAAGDVTLSVSLAGQQTQASLRLSPAQLQSLSLEPARPRLAAGSGLPLHAIGHYTDGSLQALTAQVAWSSDAPSLAVIDAGGHLQGLSPGTTTLHATLAGVTASVPVEVSTAQLLSLTLAPAELHLAVGEQLDLHATGGFSDGSTQPLDDALRWESAQPNVASVDQHGRLRALSIGTGRVTASLNGVAGSLPLTVDDATLDHLEITGATTLARGSEANFRAVAVYSNGRRRDVTTQAVWQSEAPQVLSVNNGEAGDAHAQMEGNGTLVVRFGGLEERLPVSIHPAQLDGLQMAPAPNTLASGASLRLQVNARYRDGSLQPLEREVVWRSSDPALASVGNSDERRGLVVAAIDRAGSVDITAEYGGFRASQSLEIRLEPQRPASLVVLPNPNLLRNDGSDSAHIRLRLQAADPNATVADGTPLTVTVSRDGQPLTTSRLTTVDGEAAFDFTTTTSGLLVVEAVLDDQTVRGQGVIYASAQPLEVVIPAAFADAQRVDGKVSAGGRFGFFLFNTSNRPIPLVAFEFSNGGTPLLQLDQAADLNGGRLGGGTQLGFVITLRESIPDEGLSSRFILTDPTTNQSAGLSVVYSQP